MIKIFKVKVERQAIYSNDNYAPACRESVKFIEVDTINPKVIRVASRASELKKFRASQYKQMFGGFNYRMFRSMNKEGHFINIHNSKVKYDIIENLGEVK